MMVRLERVIEADDGAFGPAFSGSGQAEGPFRGLAGFNSGPQTGREGGFGLQPGRFGGEF